MQNIIKFVFGFIAAIIIFFVMCFAISAFAQSEVFIKPMAEDNVPTYLNTLLVDGIMAEFPDPDSTKHFDVFFDLGFTNPAGKSITYNVYGDIPQGSNLFLGAIIDESSEGFAHRWIFPLAYRSGDGRSNNNIYIGMTCPYPYRHVILTRISSWSSSCPTCKPAYYSHPTPTNGQAAYVDAVSYIQLQQSVKKEYDFRYGNTAIHRNMQGLKTLTATH